MALTLYVGSKRYSSWSLRPYLALAHTGEPFDCETILLDEQDTKAKIAKVNPAGKVPVLHDDDLVIWDSLAICEYVAELFPDAKLWPAARVARARARAVSAEMHAGFKPLRTDMPMDVISRKPGVGHTPGAILGLRHVGQQNTDVRPRGLRCPVECLPMLGERPGSFVELGRDGAEPVRGLVAKAHQVAGHDPERAMVFGNLLRQRAQNILQGPRFLAHRDHGPGEFLRFLAARAAEHQPDQAHQCQRACQDSDPLGDRRAGQRLVGQRPAGGPGGVSGPQDCEDAEAPAKHLPPALARDALDVADLGPIHPAEARLAMAFFAIG